MKPLNPPQGSPKHLHCPHPTLAPGALFHATAPVRSLVHRALWLLPVALVPPPPSRLVDSD
ncbi:hypothetical protein GMOD_00005977 [Pyrenophora seminiperda CCB06]|uniref:Uncharacterized protein n=1 Tax=Pyrenophora seminiperda CCB06 TaxID=1302712 RepID=A0A3M7M414_9PLEO|nr:hypothetical protein GMOD_00005977 [Pyrenophora seminiperda CCB06]